MIAFLLVLNFFTASQAVFLEQSWASVGQSQLLFILTVIALVCVVASDLKVGRKGKPLEETGRSFSLTFIFGASWLFIVLALANPALSFIEQLLMTIYFTKAAAIEELVFRYALPRLLFVEGYNYWISQIISNGLFSLAHFFVWEYSLTSALIGLAFGFAEMLAFSYGRSFMGIVWGHALHNLALAGANWWFLALATGALITVAYIKDWRK
jgi:hypothetical protein